MLDFWHFDSDIPPLLWADEDLDVCDWDGSYKHHRQVDFSPSSKSLSNHIRHACLAALHGNLGNHIELSPDGMPVFDRKITVFLQVYGGLLFLLHR